MALPVVGLALLAGLGLVARGAAAQSASGTVTGRVLWGSCVRAIPLPMTPEGQPVPAPGPPSVAPGVPDTADQQPVPGRPFPGPGLNGLPAGAVLVAVQNTAVSARTDEAGRFSLSGVPAGQYMTVAAGPVANSTSAMAERPNVFVNGGQSVDIGTLALGGPSPYGIACGFPFGVPGAAPGAAPADTPSPPAP